MNYTLIIQPIIKQHLVGTPLEGYERSFIEQGINTDVDPLLAIAIGKAESQLGNSYNKQFNNKYHNYAGMSSGGKLIVYADWDTAIAKHFELLKRLLSHKPETLDMLGAVYAEDPLWPAKVARFYNGLWTEALDNGVDN